MKTVIFLGPSLAVTEARQILDAIYLPPAQQADLITSVTRYRPDVIGLIDGVFSQSLSVWHKEILFALEEGVTVYGSSSMGALRAAETDVYGMVGIGDVYRMYATGELTDDDEVALTHGPADSGYRKISEPMVNLRKTFEAALRDKIINTATHDRLVAIAKELFFPDRGFGLIFKIAGERGVSPEAIDRMRSFVREGYVDVKKNDAVELLKTIRDLPEKPAAKPFVMTRSHLFDTLYNRDRMVYHEETEVPLASIATHASLHLPDFLELNENALNRELVGVLGELLDVAVDPEDVDREIQRFQFRRGIPDRAALDAWIGRNDLSQAEFQDLMRSQAVCRKLHRWLITRKYLERTTRTILDELRLHGRYEEAAEEAAVHERIFQSNFPSFEEDQHDRVGMQELITQHLGETACRFDTHFTEWSEEAGFKDVSELRYELLRARLVRRLKRDIALELQKTLGFDFQGGDE